MPRCAIRKRMDKRSIVASRATTQVSKKKVIVATIMTGMTTVMGLAILIQGLSPVVKSFLCARDANPGHVMEICRVATRPVPAASFPQAMLCLSAMPFLSVSFCRTLFRAWLVAAHLLAGRIMVSSFRTVTLYLAAHFFARGVSSQLTVPLDRAS